MLQTLLRVQLMSKRAALPQSLQLETLQLSILSGWTVLWVHCLVFSGCLPERHVITLLNLDNTGTEGQMKTFRITPQGHCMNI